MADRPLSLEIRRPLLLKADDLVLLNREDGDIPDEISGFGLFCRDTCYLAAYRLRLHGTTPLLLLTLSDSDGTAAQIGLTNSYLSTENGDRIVDHKLTVRRPLLPDGVDRLELYDVRVADARVSLAFAWSGSGVQVEIVDGRGGLELVLDREAA